MITLGIARIWTMACIVHYSHITFGLAAPEFGGAYGLILSFS